MAIPTRNVSITGVFAESAATTIPAVPVAGTSYRDTGMTTSEVQNGWPYKTIVDSSQFNQAMFQYSSITAMQEKYGFLPWSDLTDYEQGSLCLGTDGVLYQAKQATGPSSTAYNPVNDTAQTYWRNYYESYSDFILKKIFPVNSIYCTHTNTNPNTILGFGTWTLFATNVVTSLSATAPVKGNGMTIGLTTGTENGGLFLGSTGFAKIGKSDYGTDIGTPRVDDTMEVGKTIGVTTDSSKSGMVADLSSSANRVTVYMWRRTA